MTKTATVLGAGIQGVCIALMLAKHGYKVQLIDKNWSIINRSSLIQEGKIHLGFVYGMDKSHATGHRMITDALHFAPYMNYLLGQQVPWEHLKSKSNVYLVIRDSMISADEANSYFDNLDSEFQKRIKNNDLNYLGSRPEKIYAKIGIPVYTDPRFVSAAFRTAETSLDQAGLRHIISSVLSNLQEIELFLECRVEEVARTSNGFSVECINKNNDRQQFYSDILVNCLWESRIRFDRMIGMITEETKSIRLKFGLLLRTDEFLQDIDSVTMIHGPYGSLVVMPNSSMAFCSWYPASMRGIMDYGPLPEAWEQVCDGVVDKELTEKLLEENYSGFKKYFPHLKRLNLVRVTAGVILADGNKDIDKQDSGFHARIEYPIKELDGYYSISTSKFTSAPRNTMLLEKSLFGHGVS